MRIIPTKVQGVVDSTWGAPLPASPGLIHDASMTETRVRHRHLPART